MSKETDPYAEAREIIESDPNGAGSLPALLQGVLDLHERFAALERLAWSIHAKIPTASTAPPTTPLAGLAGPPQT